MKNTDKQEIFNQIIDDVHKIIINNSKPVLSGYLDPKGDLDILIILKLELSTELTYYYKLLENILKVINKHKSYIIPFRNFSQLPMLLNQYNGVKPPIPVHFHLYPDILSACQWEKNWILSSMIDDLTFWSKDTEVEKILKDTIIIEPEKVRFEFLRHHLHDTIHIYYMNFPSRTFAVSQLRYSINYVSKHLLQYFLTTQNISKKALYIDKIINKTVRGTRYEAIYSLYIKSNNYAYSIQSLLDGTDYLNKILFKLTVNSK